MKISHRFDGLARLHRKIPASTIRRYKGIMVMNPVHNNELLVNVNGETISAIWSDSVQVFEHDVVLVDVLTNSRGQSEAIVIARLANRDRPAWGVVAVVPASSATISVDGPDITRYTAFYVTSYTPTVGDRVALVWSGGRALVVGKILADFTADPATNDATTIAMPPPSEAAIEGTGVYPAANSGTWNTADSQWDTYRDGGGRVYQSSTLNGAWFYHGAPIELEGMVIDAVEFTLGARVPVGVHGEPVVVHFYLHTSETEPGITDVTRTAGPYDVWIPGGTTRNTVFLPAAWGATLIAGGGISIVGNNLAGFKAMNEDPLSGLLKLDWSAP